MAQSKKAKERKDIRELDKTKGELSAAQAAKNMVQAIRNMYNESSSSAAGGPESLRGGADRSASTRIGAGDSSLRDEDRPEWASAMSNKDYYRAGTSKFTSS